MAKEIWDGLELAHEGTSAVRKYRIDLLIQKYELFTLEKNESLDSMSSRFSSIINELKNLGRKFESKDIARKVLRSLTKKWRPKVTAMEEYDEAESSNNKSVAPQASANEDVKSNIEDETVLFVKRFKKRLFRNKQTKPFYNNKSFNKKATESKTSFINIRCFKYGEFGHMIKDCPTWEKIKDKD
ncbi:uncharacterized protein LOC141630349 [Silene latifolia]|uniref:uncharacterized protein LOC141630349 n=1 Tax=Silene latifolia TaxID=37657 RepID=UPI003D78331B